MPGGRFGRLFGTRQPGWALVDPRSAQREAPYTFFLPQPEELAAVRAGDLVKAIFRAAPDTAEGGRERMWVEVDAVRKDGFSGILDNQPVDLKALSAGMAMVIPASHVIAVAWAEGHTPPDRPFRREFWDRCLVDPCVLEGASRVLYLYRDPPEPPSASHQGVDSGWRLRGSDAAIADDEAAGRSPRFVALGAVLNCDDRWLSLIDEPVGSAFAWDAAARRFVLVDQ